MYIVRSRKYGIERKYMKKIVSIILICVFICLGLWVVKDKARAQIDSSGIAVSIPLEGEEIVSGSMICSTQEGFDLCEFPYQPSMYGVVTDQPAAAFEGVEEGNRLVTTSGTVVVRVTASNGNIEEGNFITSSTNPGIGQLANKSGFVLGSALQSYAPDNPEEVGEILIALDIHPASGLAGPRSDLIQVLRQGLEYPILEPLASFRYVLAALIVVIAFSVGLFYFGTVSKTGVEAIGRNPRASKMIQMSILLHVLVTIVIFLIGLAIAYLILIL